MFEIANNIILHGRVKFSMERQTKNVRGIAKGQDMKTKGHQMQMKKKKLET